MIHARSATEVETGRKAFLSRWRLKCRAVADSPEEAGERLFCFTRLDPPRGDQWALLASGQILMQKGPGSGPIM